MKKLIYLITLTIISNFSFAQISFSKTVYHVNEDIIANGTSLVEGVDNGIKNVSTKINFGTSSINLKSTSTPGFYVVTFYLSGGSKQVFLIEVLPVGVSNNSSLVFDLKYNTNKKENLLDKYKKMKEFFSKEKKDVKLSVISNGTKNFLKNNPVSVVKNVAFCLTIPESGPAAPVLTAICKDLSISNVKDLGTEIFKELFLQMKNKNYLSQADYNQIIGNIDAYTNIGGLIDGDCSAFFDFIGDKIDNNDIKIAISMQGQLCSATVLIINTYKKLP